MTPSLPPSSLHFTLHTPSTAKKFGPRLGTLVLRDLKIDTPGLITSTSRGVVPHLSRDHVRTTRAIRWVHVPFETFLEHTPPVPTLQPGPHALHTFLGYLPAQHLLSLSLRDPADGREMPANGNAHVCAYSLRGVRRISPAEWRTHVTAVHPDIVVALTDTPFTHPPYSQKRLTKSIERSTAWLADILQSSPRSSVFVHMAGQTNLPARRAFAESLTERLHGKDADAISPLRWLDEGVAGYTFDLVPLRASLDAASASFPNPPLSATTPSISSTPPSPDSTPNSQTTHLAPLLLTSLLPLPSTKPRVVHSTTSPHEVLALIRDVGIDVFDAGWAQRAADVGVALDFVFPVPSSGLGDTLGLGGGVGGGVVESEVVGDGVDTVDGESNNKPKKRHGKLDIGHNLYSSSYAFDFGALAGSFVGAYDASSTSTLNGNGSGKGKPICPCAACSPTQPTSHILHSALDANSFSSPTTSTASHNPSPSPSPTSPNSQYNTNTNNNNNNNNNNNTNTNTNTNNTNTEEKQQYKPPNTRAYIHHLLHTHEMSAHALLAMHNLAVVDAFFEGVRGVLGRSSASSTASASSEDEEGDEELGDEGVNGVGDAAGVMGVDGDEITEDTGLRLALSPTGHVILAGHPKPGFSDDDDGANSNDEMDPSQSQSQNHFETQINNFIATYAEPEALFGEATASWREVEMARGKGRLARERERVGVGEREKDKTGEGEGEGKGKECEW